MTNQRANRITVKSNGKDGFIADFYRTHKHLATVSSEDLPLTSWCEHDINSKETTNSILREDFRRYVTTNAGEWDVDWQPEDMRMESNKRRPKYESEEQIAEDATIMVNADILSLIEKMPWKAKKVQLTVDSITPITKTAKGADLEALGILDGKYANGNWAWADIELTVSMEIKKIEIYQTLQMQLVSGQLKKFKMSQAAWNQEITKSMEEAGINTSTPGNVEVEKPKKTRKSKKEQEAE